MRLIMAEDAALLRAGLVGLLERQGHQVTAQASNAPELEAVVHVAAQDGTLPDVVITDVRMPPTMSDDGLAAAMRIRSRYPGIGILILSQYVATGYAADLFAGSGDCASGSSGGLGYLLKERVARVADFLDSLAIVARGGTVIDPEVASQLVANRRSALDTLSPREHEVLKLMARGMSNAQIAEQLVLSAGAVSKHVANVFTKLSLPPEEDNRRVRAVLTYLTAGRAHY